MKIFKTILNGARVWLITAASVLALVLVISLLLTQNLFLYNMLNTAFGGPERVLKAGDPSQYQYFTPDKECSDKETTLVRANELNEEICEEGIVLLKNEDHALPLESPADKSVSVFGKNSVDLVYGGSGSGGANTADAVTLYDSLTAAGIEYNPALKNFYENNSLSGAGRPSNPGMNDFHKNYVIMLYVYNIICCILAIFIQFEIPRRTLLERDLATSNHIRYQERKQYNLTKENIQLINLKCHDLKYQIRQIGDHSSVNKETMQEIEDVISIYDSVVKTNNETLDVILTEKSLLCNNLKIKLACIVAGEKLGFMNDADLYSLFGNLIDNAIEAVRDLDEEKRTIGLLVKAARSFLSVNIHIYYDKVLVFQNNIPLTTKEDKYYHGYGMKSVRHICDKYNGEMTISTDNGIFNVNIVFPLSQEPGER